MKKAKKQAVPPVVVNNYHTNKPHRAIGGPAQSVKTKQVNNYLTSDPIVASTAPYVLDEPQRDVQDVSRAVNGKKADEFVGKPKPKKIPMPPTDLAITDTKPKGKKNAKN